MNKYQEQLLKVFAQVKVLIAKQTAAVKKLAAHLWPHIQQKWSLPTVRMGTYIGVALISGILLGNLFFSDGGNQHKKGEEKVVTVNKVGILSVSLPGVKLDPEVFEFATSVQSDAPMSLSVPGRLAFNGERVKVVAARVAGRVERILAFDGAIVKAGQVLAEFYSPDYVSAQTEYLLSLKMVNALRGTATGSLYDDALSTLDAAANHLRVLGGAGEDINYLRAGGKPTPTFPMRAPIEGVVIKRAVDPGAYMNAGDMLATIADPKQLWFLGNIYEQDIPKIKVGDTFKLYTESYPDREFTAKANYVGPSIDPTTHTLVVRCDVENTEGLLRPEMFVNGKLVIGQSKAIVLPSSAIIQIRNSRFVIIRTGENEYKRLPIIGYDSDAEHFAITEGLNPNEQVMIRGATLMNQRFLRSEE